MAVSDIDCKGKIYVYSVALGNGTKCGVEMNLDLAAKSVLTLAMDSPIATQYFTNLFEKEVCDDKLEMLEKVKKMTVKNILNSINFPNCTADDVTTMLQNDLRGRLGTAVDSLIIKQT